jgi:hypothetical protein
MAERKTIDEVIAGHEARNASLRRVFSQKQIDLMEPRRIECHFWTRSRKGATELGEALKTRGFEILRQNRAATRGDAGQWNLEAAVRQSIDLTIRREFTDELVKLADSHGGVYDGWGTSV